MWRTAFAKAGEYDEELPHGYGEDYDWLLAGHRASARSVSSTRSWPTSARTSPPGSAARPSTPRTRSSTCSPSTRTSRPTAPGHARMLGQISYAQATAGERGEAFKYAGRRCASYPDRATCLAGIVHGTTGVSPQRVLGLARSFGGGCHDLGPARRRRLPNFIYIGPDKAGSSWLHEMLIRHPEVYLTPAKDLYFFDRYFDRGMGGTPSSSRTPRDPQGRRRGLPGLPLRAGGPRRRIAETSSGQVKTMVSLRDPVERAWSSWLYARKHGMWPEDFLDGPSRSARTARARAVRRRPRPLHRAFPARERPHRGVRRPRRRIRRDSSTRRRTSSASTGCRSAPRSASRRLPLRRARSVKVAQRRARAADFAREHGGRPGDRLRQALSRSSTGCCTGRSTRPRSAPNRSRRRLTSRRPRRRRTPSGL